MKTMFDSGSPFIRRSYVSMLLGFHPLYYTNDYEDGKIMYGDRIPGLRYRLLYIQLRRLLVKKGITDFSKLDRLFSEQKWDELFREIDKYNIDGNLVDVGIWSFFRSHSLESNGFHSNDVKHRLYLNIGLDYRAYFTKLFIDYCVKENLPYYFKVLGGKGQTDTVVVYVDTDEHLKSTLNIINRIYASKKNLRDVTKEPPPHLYKVNDYVGYGFEPPLVNGERMTYTELMKECAYPVAGKRKALRDKMMSDFLTGKVYRTNNPNIIVPSIGEMQGFSQLDKTGMYKFFNKYFPYILAVYGGDIAEILTDIQAHIDSKFSSESSKNNSKK